LITADQGRRASLRSALAPGYHIPRLWRCGDRISARLWRCGDRISAPLALRGSDFRAFGAAGLNFRAFGAGIGF